MSPRNKWYKCSYIVCCIYCIFYKLVSLLFTLLIFFVDTFFSWLYTLWVFFRQLFAIWLIFDTRKCPQKKIILKRIILFLNQRRDVGIPSFPQDSIDHLFSVFFSKTTNVNYKRRRINSKRTLQKKCIFFLKRSALITTNLLLLLQKKLNWKKIDDEEIRLLNKEAKRPNLTPPVVRI